MRPFKKKNVNTETVTAETGGNTVVEEKKKKPGVVHFIFHAVLAGLLTIISALALIIFVIPIFLGAVPMTVLTQSMEPTIKPGDLVVVKPVDVKTLKIGDVVTIQPTSGDPELVTHRVVGINLGQSGDKAGILTRGDNNDKNDPMYKTEQIRGKVQYMVPKVGWVRQYPQLGWAAVALLLGYFLVSLIRPSKEDKRRKEDESRREQRLAELEAELARRKNEDTSPATSPEQKSDNVVVESAFTDENDVENKN